MEDEVPNLVGRRPALAWPFALTFMLLAMAPLCLALWWPQTWLLLAAAGVVGAGVGEAVGGVVRLLRRRRGDRPAGIRFASHPYR